MSDTNGTQRVPKSQPWGSHWLTASFSSTKDAVVAGDAQGRVAFMNPAAEGLTGWPTAEAAGQPLETVLIILDEDSGQSLPMSADANAGPNIRMGFENSKFLVAKGGTKKSIEHMALPMQDAAGKPLGVLAVLREIHPSQAIAKDAPHREEQFVRRIVVVDDNVGTAKMLSQLLKMLGDYEVQLAHDGMTALELIQTTHPEIVLLDIGLPGKNGYQVAEAIRAQAEFDVLLLVALTGYGLTEDMEKSKAAGFDAHYVKPPSVEQMKKILSHPKLNAKNRTRRSNSPSLHADNTAREQDNPLDVPRLRHDLKNVAYVLSLVEEMFLTHGNNLGMMKQAGTALSSEIDRLNGLIELLENPGTR